MPITTLVMVRRKAGLTTEQFRNGYETSSSISAISTQPWSKVKVPALPAGSCILTIRDRTESLVCSTT